MLRNVSPLHVAYSFEWQEESIIIEDIQPIRVLANVQLLFYKNLPVSRVCLEFSTST